MKKIIIFIISSFFLLLPMSNQICLSSPILQNSNHIEIIQPITSVDLKSGDIMFETVYTFLMYVHTLMFIRYEESNETYVFIEAPANSPVRYEYFSYEAISDPSHYKFGRVIVASDQQIQNAVLFAESQLGKEFQDNFIWPKNYNPNDPDDMYADAWYCSELIWAAYYNCDHHPDEQIFGDGIDIDYNYGPFVKPRDIRRDLDVKVFFFEDLTIFDKILILIDYLTSIYEWFIDLIS